MKPEDPDLVALIVQSPPRSAAHNRRFASAFCQSKGTVPILRPRKNFVGRTNRTVLSMIQCPTNSTTVRFNIIFPRISFSGF